MAEYGVATIPVLMPHRRLRPRAADPSRPWNTTQPSPTSATHIGKRLAGKLHEPFERAGGGRAINPTSPDSIRPKRSSTMNWISHLPCLGALVAGGVLAATAAAQNKPAAPIAVAAATNAPAVLETADRL